MRDETHAAVVAEMRGTDNKCQLATKDGTGCYHCPFGSAASNCLFDKFANRAEAAHKREVDNLNSVIQTQRSHFDAEIDRLRREEISRRGAEAQSGNAAVGCPPAAVGNAAKMREAVIQISKTAWAARTCNANEEILKNTYLEDIIEMCKSALSAPPRNCDRFKTKEEAAIAFAKEKKQWIPQQVLWGLAAWLDWLFAPANEKGENDGR